MPVAYIESITARYARLGYPPYRWFHAVDAPPWQPLDKPLSGTRLGLLSTSGAYLPGQVAYHYKDDTSMRAIPKETPPARLHFAHLTENYLADPRRDPDCIFPISALNRLQAEGTIGELAPDHYSCMGAVYSQRRVREELAPAALEAFRAQRVDAVLLVPM